MSNNRSRESGARTLDMAGVFFALAGLGNERAQGPSRRLLRLVRIRPAQRVRHFHPVQVIF
jgi:hypothetical protein